MHLKNQAICINARKIHLIEEVLKVNDESILTQLETLLEKTKKSKGKKASIYDFVGVMSKQEVVQMRKAIIFQ